MTCPSSTILRPRALAVLAALSAFGCGGDWQNDKGYAKPAGRPDDSTTTTGHPVGLHAVGNHIEDDAGNVIQLRGVNRSGTEYKCVQGGLFDGPNDEKSVAAIATWNVNAVR